MDYALSNLDIKKILKNHRRETQIYFYNDLSKIFSLNELFEKDNHFILLYENSGIGHWVCLIKHNEEHVEVFDSYGMLPDDQMKFMTIKYDKKLCELLQEFNKVDYNDFQFQKFDKNISTCGRWCICRIIYKSFMIDDFIELFKNIDDKVISEFIN